MSTGHKRKKIRMVLCSCPGAGDASNDTVQRVRLLSEDLFAHNEIYSDGGDIGYSQSRRKFRVAIDSDDLKSLRPGHMLKGGVINFFIKHLDYGNEQEKDANIETYSTDFYPMLSNGGIQNVLNFQKINSFSRKILNMPVCFGNHWRLIVSLNPGHVLDSSATGPMCCILGFDSCTGDERLIQSKAPLIRAWLNAKWGKTYPKKRSDPFNEITMPAFAPSICKQSTVTVNECGIHTMLALRMMYKLRSYDFCKGENRWFTRDFRKKCGYGQAEVIELRKATSTYINRLHHLQCHELGTRSDDDHVPVVCYN